MVRKCLNYPWRFIYLKEINLINVVDTMKDLGFGRNLSIKAAFFSEQFTKNRRKVRPIQNGSVTIELYWIFNMENKAKKSFTVRTVIRNLPKECMFVERVSLQLSMVFHQRDYFYWFG